MVILNKVVESNRSRSIACLSTYQYLSFLVLAMDNLPSKKAKLTTPRASRIRYTLELAFEPRMEERLKRLKYRLQRARNSLFITTRTPKGKCLADGRTSGLIRAVRTKGNGDRVKVILIPLCFHSCRSSRELLGLMFA